MKAVEHKQIVKRITNRYEQQLADLELELQLARKQANRLLEALNKQGDGGSSPEGPK